MPNPIIHMDVVCYKEDDLFVAHCLQLDLVTTATTVHQACINMEDVIKAHITYALNNNNLKNIFKPAPPEIWQLMSNADVIDGKPIQELSFPSLPPPHLIYQIQRLCVQ